MPEWLSDHPNPGNRYEYISKEAQALRVSDPIRDTRGFEQAQARLKQMNPAPTTAEVARKCRESTPGNIRHGQHLGSGQPPSARFVTYRAGTLMQVSVPDNWRQLPGSRSVTFAPEGAFASSGGQSVFTHGVEAGEAPAAGRDLRSATEGLIASLAQANPGLRRLSDAQSGMDGDQRGLRVVLSNTSDATGQPERLAVYTALLDDGHLFYAVAVAPQEAFNRYDETFSKVISSLRLQNHR